MYLLIFANSISTYTYYRYYILGIGCYVAFCDTS